MVARDQKVCRRLSCRLPSKKKGGGPKEPPPNSSTAPGAVPTNSHITTTFVPTLTRS
ncbi:hypothetical protein SAMN05443582_106130 [Phyllobacterium sp. OV277]|nr:hypothetical protein SAMN05443582_106130 [Phyllobacterium sp. OV277]